MKIDKWNFDICFDQSYKKEIIDKMEEKANYGKLIWNIIWERLFWNNRGGISVVNTIQSHRRWLQGVGEKRGGNVSLVEI